MKLLSVTQYAQLHNLTRQGVLRRIKAKTISATKVGNTWVVHPLVEEFRASEPEPESENDKTEDS